ncbi:hypothetical protein [Streptomyces triticiradicis]|uniref:hypothetical protein n=1 Tax=Streptomyces triticiradicis TaxID=2651189 RepID=UPI00298DBBD9|nr:hypothetical protein [Streptomyces triticiradicis]
MTRPRHPHPGRGARYAIESQHVHGGHAAGPAPPPQGYDGTSPFPPDGPAPARDGGERLYVTVTTVIVVLPFVAIGLAG